MVSKCRAMRSMSLTDESGNRTPKEQETLMIALPAGGTVTSVAQTGFGPSTHGRGGACRPSLLLLIFLLAATAGRVRAQEISQSAAPGYEQAMNRLTQPYLDQRQKTIAAIHTRAQAEARQAWVRATLLRLIGGLPDNHDPLNAMVLGSSDQDGYRIERLIYDSLPGYHVTANLYLPAHGQGPFPAIVYNGGHGPWGKAEAGFGFAGNLARDGFAVLAYDPLGAGERLQAMNPATGKSWAGPDEHSQANIPMSLIGDNVSRYMVWDAMRGIDYLQTRPDIDEHNIGSFGCSGGGTLSAYLAALDPRVKAAVVACYLTSWDALLHTIGPQDGEQVVPNFIKSGLGFPDLVELAAPRGYAMVSTTEDMFPFSGATTTHAEAERFYSLLGAANHLQWFTGPGHHGAIFPLMPKFIAFFNHWLRDDDAPPSPIVHLPMPPKQDIQCTSTGQVTTALPGRTIYEINQERARVLRPQRPAITTSAALAALQRRLHREIPAVTGMSPVTVPSEVVSITATEQRSGYRLETAVVHSLSGMDLPARLAVPNRSGRRPALLITSDQPIAALTASGSDFDHAAVSGRVVLAMTPLPWPPSSDKPRPTMGINLPWTSRAFLIGKTFVGMRTRDMIGAVEWLAGQHNVDADQIAAIGDGSSGVVLLHAGVLEPRIREITLKRTLSTYQSVLDVPVHRNVADSVIPGVLLHYDLDDLMIAIGPRRIVDVDPVDGADRSLSEDDFLRAMRRVVDTDRALGWRSRLTFSQRSVPDPTFP